MRNPVLCPDASIALTGRWLDESDRERLSTGQPLTGISDGSD